MPRRAGAVGARRGGFLLSVAGAAHGALRSKGDGAAGRGRSSFPRVAVRPSSFPCWPWRRPFWSSRPRGSRKCPRRDARGGSGDPAAGCCRKKRRGERSGRMVWRGHMMRSLRQSAVLSRRAFWRASRSPSAPAVHAPLFPRHGAAAEPDARAVQPQLDLRPSRKPRSGTSSRRTVGG